MQISRLFDKYWIHENFLKTQPHSRLMLVKTLTKLFEHGVQHPFAPLQARPLRILFFMKDLAAAMVEAFADLRSMRAHRPPYGRAELSGSEGLSVRFKSCQPHR